MCDDDLNMVKGNMVAEDPNALKDDEDGCESTQSNTQSGTDQTIELFKLVFSASQKPDQRRQKLQTILAWILTIALSGQVVWALWLITYIVRNNTSIAANALTFTTLLVTAILAEVLAMAFFVVRFVFKTPLDTMLDLLKDIINKR